MNDWPNSGTLKLLLFFSEQQKHTCNFSRSTCCGTRTASLPKTYPYVRSSSGWRFLLHQSGGCVETPGVFVRVPAVDAHGQGGRWHCLEPGKVRGALHQFPRLGLATAAPLLLLLPAPSFGPGCRTASPCSKGSGDWVASVSFFRSGDCLCVTANGKLRHLAAECVV